ncbi:MAG: hypothetical protein IT175_00060 [Acidobacteria bacterium]|nr:hypothetical protein [Acidobacteriota bacterium]
MTTPLVRSTGPAFLGAARYKRFERRRVALEALGGLRLVVTRAFRIHVFEGDDDSASRCRK